MYTNRFAGLLLLLCLPLTLSQAEELEISEIVVTATRTEEAVLTAPGHVTVLDEEEISRSGAKNLADLLTLQAGLNVSDYGPEGSTKSLSIRGSTSSQVLILVNGVRFNNSVIGGVDLADIPMDSIEKIELVRGGFSALYGSDAVGGVINIITKREATNQFTLKIENGSFVPRQAVEVSEGPTETNVDTNWLDLTDTQKLNIGYSAELGNSVMVTSGSFTRAGNGFVWNDRKYIQDYRRRINADLLGGDAYLSLIFPIADGSFEANGSAAYKQVGAPGEIDPAHFSVSTDAGQTTLSAQGQMVFNTDRFLTDLLSLDIGGFYKFYGLDYEDPPFDPSSVKLHTVGIDLVQEFIALDILSIVYGGNLNYEQVHSSAIDERSRFSGGIFLEPVFYPVRNLSIIPAVRYDYFSDFPGNLNFKLNVVYALNDSVSLKIAGGKSYRVPTLNDLYWPDEFGTRGNVNLDPETGYFGETGISVLTDRAQVNMFLFTRYLIDAIVWDFNPITSYYEPLNVGESLFPGAELDTEINLIKDLWLTGNYTFIYSYLLEGFSSNYQFSDDKRAPYTPLHSVDAAIEYRGSKTSGGLHFEFVDKTYKDDGNTIQIDAYTLFNFRLRHQLNDYLLVSLRINNMLNNVYEVVDGYIAPPVSIWLGAELTL